MTLRNWNYYHRRPSQDFIIVSIRCTTTTTSKSVLLCRTLCPVTKCNIKYVRCTGSISVLLCRTLCPVTKCDIKCVGCTGSLSVLLCRTLRPVTECDIKYVGCTVHQLVLTEIVLFHRSCLITPHPVQLRTSRRVQFKNRTKHAR